MDKSKISVETVDKQISVVGTDGMPGSLKSPAQELQQPLDSFPPVFNVISLRECADRRVTSSAAMAKAGMKHQFFLVDKDKEIPLRGSTTSHQKLFQKCIDEDLKWIAVCEDSILCPRDVPHDYLESLQRFVENEDFNLIYLGAFFLPHARCMKVPEYKNVFKVRQGLVFGAYCYIISRKFCEQMVKVKFDGTGGIDWIFAKSGDLHIYKPLIFWRSRVKSTQLSILDLPRKFWLHPWVYEVCERKFFSNCLIESLVAILLIIFIVLILIVYLIARATVWCYRGVCYMVS